MKIIIKLRTYNKFVVPSFVKEEEESTVSSSSKDVPWNVLDCRLLKIAYHWCFFFF